MVSDASHRRHCRHRCRRRRRRALSTEQKLFSKRLRHIPKVLQ